MAFFQARATEYGVAAMYWRITRTDIDWGRRIATIVLSGYYDRERRENECLPLAEETITILPAEFSSWFVMDEHPIVSAYACARQHLPFLAEARSDNEERIAPPSALGRLIEKARQEPRK